MIVGQRLDVIRVSKRLGPLLLLLLAYDTAVTLLFVLGVHWVGIDDLPLPLLGSAIALIVTFRNNAAYNRWWEARGLWGAVVNNSRSLARALLTVTDDPLLQTRLVRQQIAYAIALRCNLLQSAPWQTIDKYLPADVAAGLRAAVNVPTAIQNAMARELAEARRTGTVSSIALAALDRTLTDLANAQGGLERIKKTPLPRQYDQFPRVFVAVYCLLLPIGLVHTLAYSTPIASTLIGFMFLSLDVIGRDLQDPFTGGPHDVPMQAIVRTIEIDLLQAIRDTGIPEPIVPEDGLLW
jgi:putative membrane protein